MGDTSSRKHFSNPVPAKLALMHAAICRSQTRREVCHTRKAMTNLKADLLRHRSCFFLPNPLLLCKWALQTEMQVIVLPVSCICKPCFQTNLSHPTATTMCYFNCDIQLIQKYIVDLGQNTHVLIHYIFSTQLWWQPKIQMVLDPRGGLREGVEGGEREN